MRNLKFSYFESLIACCGSQEISYLLCGPIGAFLHCGSRRFFRCILFRNHSTLEIDYFFFCLVPLMKGQAAGIDNVAFEKITNL